MHPLLPCLKRRPAYRLLSQWSVVAALLAGCAAPLPPPAPVATPVLADPAAAWYANAAKAGQQVYRIDPAQSLVTVTVRRGGTLARLGHDHVVASRTVSGYAAYGANAANAAAAGGGRADFQFRLDQMTVDEPALRSAAGLTTQPNADAIAGTRTNMLTRVLDAERFPLVLLHAEQAADQGAGPAPVRLSITLHGVTRTVEVATRIERATDRLAASGELALLQTDFGITPMSVMGGAIAVQDRMELRFSIVATALR